MTDDRDLIDDLYDDDDDEDTQKDLFFTFLLGGEEYGVSIKHVIEVIGLQKITEVPDMPEFVKGVINLRGQVIPVMDVRTRFNMEEREYDDRTCVVVVSVKDVSIGLMVDEVSDVMSIPEEMIEPAPKISRQTSHRFIEGLGKTEDNVVILLDVDKLLFEQELEQVAS